MRLLDPPSPMVSPEHYTGMVLLATTVVLEAGGEPWIGKVGVAFNMCNRALQLAWSLHKVILGPDEKAYDDGHPYETYSCWNDDYRQQARVRIDALQAAPALWEECYKAAAAAYWQLWVDPTHGAFFYMNVEETKRIRGDGSLPLWWDLDADSASEIKIGKHTFRRHK